MAQLSSLAATVYFLPRHAGVAELDAS